MDKDKYPIKIVYTGLEKIQVSGEESWKTDNIWNVMEKCVDRINMLIDIQNEELNKRWRGDK